MVTISIVTFVVGVYFGKGGDGVWCCLAICLTILTFAEGYYTGKNS